MLISLALLLLAMGQVPTMLTSVQPRREQEHERRTTLANRFASVFVAIIAWLNVLRDEMKARNAQPDAGFFAKTGGVGLRARRGAMSP